MNYNEIRNKYISNIKKCVYSFLKRVEQLKSEYSINKSVSIINVSRLLNDLYSTYNSLEILQEIDNSTFIKNDFIDNTIGTYDDDILHIVFPCLVPQKIKFSKLQDNAYRLKNIIENETFVNTVYKVCENLNIPRYNEKVVAVVISHYNNKNDVKDIDNQDIKHIIDALSIICLIDDSPIYLSHFYDGIIDNCKDNYSEIYIVPERKFTDSMEYKKRMN